MRLFRIALAAALPLTAFPMPESNASTPEAWSAFFALATERCRADSGVDQAAVIWPPVSFDGTVLVLVTGRWTQPHMHHAAARLLCLYDRDTGRTTITEQPQAWRSDRPH